MNANAHMTPRELRQFCSLDRRGAALLKAAVARLGFSARAYHRVLKIARTIADLDGADDIASVHVAEAVQYRSMDRGRIG
jgi:magnesium chelatase family protein